MGYACVIAGGKGGVGKTTTAINLATVAAATHDVALLDADLEMANVGAMLGVDPAVTIHDVLAGEATLADALVDGDDGPALVLGDRGLDAYAAADPAGLDAVVAALRDAYDLVIVDTGAGFSHDSLVPLGLADGILLVTTPDAVAVGDAEKTAELAARVDGSVTGVLVTRATPETDVEAIAADLRYPLLGVVPLDPEAGTRSPVVRRSPNGPAAAAYRSLADRLERVFFEGTTGADLAGTWEAPAAEPDTGPTGTPSVSEPGPSASDGASAAGSDGAGEGGTGAAGDAQEDAVADADEAEAADPAGTETTQEGATGDPDGAEDDDSGFGGVFGLFR